MIDIRLIKKKSSYIKKHPEFLDKRREEDAITGKPLETGFILFNLDMNPDCMVYEDQRVVAVNWRIFGLLAKYIDKPYTTKYEKQFKKIKKQYDILNSPYND